MPMQIDLTAENFFFGYILLQHDPYGKTDFLSDKCYV